MKRLLLILAFYMLASFGVQAQIVNPDGLKEMWVNDSITRSILISPDSTMYYHMYYLGSQKIFKLYKRDILTNNIIIEKNLDYNDYQAVSPEMDISSDGQYIVILPKYLYVDSIYVYSQQDLELIKKIPLNLEEILEDDYDKERFEVQGVRVTLVENPIFITNDNKIFFTGKYEGYSQIPIGERIKGYFQCIYNVESGNCINEFYSTVHDKPTPQSFQISPSKTHVLIYMVIDSELKFVYTSIEQFLDLVENENELKDYQIIEKFNPSIYNFNLEENLVCSISQSNIKVFDIINKSTIVDDLIKNYPTGSVLIDKRYITFNNEIEFHKAIISLYDVYLNKIYNIIENQTAYGNHIFIKGMNYLILDDGLKFHAYKINLEEIVGIFDKNEIIYPNPANDYIEISLDRAHLEGGQNMEIEIFDVLGNKIFNSTPSLLSNATPCPHPDLSGQEGNFKINVSQLPKGVYFVKIGNITKKFVKM